MASSASPIGLEQVLRGQIVKVCRMLSHQGLVASMDGNVSARLGADRFLATPSGMSKGEVTEEALIICDGRGQLIQAASSGSGKVTSEIRVHLAAYGERPDIGAVVHAHPPVANAFTFAGVGHWLSEPIVPEVVAILGPIAHAPFIIPGTQALADAAAPCFRNADVVMLTRHGAVTVGKDPWEAWLRMDKLEHTAILLKYASELAGSFGAIRKLDAHQIDELLREYGRGKGGRDRPVAEAGGAVPAVPAVPEVMTIEEAAAYLKLHPQVVYRHVRAGILPASRIGRTIRFKRSVLDQFLNQSGWDSVSDFVAFRQDKPEPGEPTSDPQKRPTPRKRT